MTAVADDVPGGGVDSCETLASAWHGRLATRQLGGGRSKQWGAAETVPRADTREGRERPNDWGEG